MAVTHPAGRGPVRTGTGPSSWTFLTNHAHVLLAIASEANIRIRDIALRVGITERAVQKILFDLEEGGYLTHEREGRRNVYRVLGAKPLRHPLESHHTVGEIVRLIVGSPAPARRGERASARRGARGLTRRT